MVNCPILPYYFPIFVPNIEQTKNISFINMRKKVLLLLVTWLSIAATLQASDPFRRHRENAFSAISNKEGSIVFIGNSITHMNEWRESFGVPENVSILNRGISGAISDEVVKNLESYIANKPSKVFLMIGTNDLGTGGMNYPEYPFRNLKKIIERIRKESPHTMVYVQSILPSSVGTRSYNIPLTNPKYQAYVEGLEDDHVQWVDLYDRLKNGDTNNMAAGTSLDNLHPNAAGYNIWTQTIKEQAGIMPIYPENLTSIGNGDASYGGIGQAWGMRISNFYRFKMEADNILLLGDEVFHGSEFHELLGNEKVLGHGIGWGYGSATIAYLRQMAKASLGPNSYLKAGVKREAPKQIYLYVGTSDLTGDTSAEAAITQYGTLLTEVKKLAPTSKIFVLSVLNTVTDATHLQKIKDFNARLKTLAESTADVTFVDAYTALNNANGTRVEEYFCDPEGGKYYVSGLGYARLAELLAETIGEGCTPTTVEQARKIKAINDARNALGIVVSKALDVRYDGTAGSYTEDAKTVMNAALSEAYAELAKGQETTVEALNAKIAPIETALAGIKDFIVRPQTSTDGHLRLYTLASHRGNKFLTGNGTDQGLTGEEDKQSPRQAWKFVLRDDHTFDIVNHADGSYLAPTAAANAQVHTSAEQPANGWTLKACDQFGAFIITSGTAQLNQSNATAVLNWGGGSNTNDVGCQYYVTETEFPANSWCQIRYEKNAALSGQYEADALTGRYILNKETEYNQDDQYWYPLGVSTEALTPENDDACYYVNIQDAGGDNIRYVQSANGHYLSANATSTQTPMPVAYTVHDDGVSLGSYFISFPNLGNTWGKSSAAAHAATRYNVTPVNLEEAGLTPWKVILMNAVEGADISKNTRVSCTTAGLKGLSKVYDQGTFFLPTGTNPLPEDFSIEGYFSDVTINTDAKYINVTVGNPFIDPEEARALLALEGPGYPSATSATRRNLAAALENDDTQAIAEAVLAYKADTDVSLPESGKAYYIVSTHSDGKLYYFNNTAAGLNTVATTTTDNLPESALFIARKAGNQCVFVNTLGQYLIFKGSNAGANGNKGFLTAYDAAQCRLTPTRFTRQSGTDASLLAGLTDANLFGCMTLMGKRSNGTTDVYFVVKNAGGFDQAGTAFYNTGFSSALKIIEAADWHNAVSREATEEGRNLGTVALPFAVDKGSVKAYTVKVDAEKATLSKTETKGTVIPAHTPVLLEWAAEAPVLLIPAIQAGTAVTDNDLVSTATSHLFTLGMQDDRAGFFPFSGTLAAGKACLSFESAPAFTALYLSTPTGINRPATADKALPSAYDLGGRRVQQPAEGGIYVIDGQKVLVK